MNLRHQSFLLCLCVVFLMVTSALAGQLQAEESPTRIGIVGLVHTHVHWILGEWNNDDYQVVGIVEPNRELAEQYAQQHGYPMEIVFETMEEMVEATNPEAVTAFNTIYGHLKVVEFCAPRGIHVMVEKPLAVNLDHARQMEALAKEHNIHLLTNYETSWYPSHSSAYDLIHAEDQIGDIRKMVFHHGHPGPIEIGCNPEFVEWLTDPALNGGGALTDFGCYGANLSTWMLLGEEPLTVSCTRQTFKPDMYPEVEDEATIVLTYPTAQVIIQASWNWPYNRKDMEVYGESGYVVCENGQSLEILRTGEEQAESMIGTPLSGELSNPFRYLGAVLRGDITPRSHEVSALPNNMTVMRILEAARLSAERGEVIEWSEVAE
ncbi:MAG: Gfo/Idh/MocA family oxidoreductase [Planctomycetota bacterium]